MFFLPFPLMENEAKRSRPELSANPALRFGPGPRAAKRSGGEAATLFYNHLFLLSKRDQITICNANRKIIACINII